MNTKLRQKRFSLILIATLLLISFGCGRGVIKAPTPSAESVAIAAEVPAPVSEPTSLPHPQLKYIFLLIGDGMGYAQIQAASEALAADNRDPLCFLDFPVQASVKTSNILGKVTDSAAAATAISTGQKTINRYLGLDQNKNRIETVAETLRNIGRKIGILTTVSLDHATPGGFYAHVDSRRNYSTIADDLFASGFDYFAGGGFHRTPDAPTHAEENGYTLIHSFEEAPATNDGRLILSSSLIFGDYGVLPAIDGGARVDWLKKATDLAISRLTNPAGFFMMVEGGRIDYFCHYNDAASFVGELLDFDKAVQSAIAFYQQHPEETLVIVTADHETGDVSFTKGDRSALLSQIISSDTCDNTLVADCVAAKTSFDQALPIFASAFGLTNLTAKETAVLKEAYYRTIQNSMPGNTSDEESGVYDPITTACINLVAARAGVVFGSGGHTAKDVPLYALGIGSEFFSGSYENTRIHDAILEAVSAYPIS
ncbi:MAG: alkaline phosphatase [Eubacteriales bacterium]|nr:alkaline phosphatase [Eubacteriales bacterium]